jgi:hypothetical protein
MLFSAINFPFAQRRQGFKSNQRKKQQQQQQQQQQATRDQCSSS